MSVRRGDIVLVQLDPTKGSEIRKTRPAVVVQNDTGNQYSPTTIIAPMTTTISEYPFVVVLRASDEEVEKDSAVQLDQIRTVDVEKRIERTLGQVSDEKMGEIDTALKVSLGLA
ncbi:type II toxin-antitoxin system PemK/MazF family toxin [Haladaptatus halobius]|uniref:type II toxin-antitoxin system PemK/MazF family toxin n=1 Tax=Haladaptatus halobius TaxID=2884875 RepID=UPI001D0A2E0D|nr:type II toxin-antitoxin system PemK/MazF family toxin [Haladaptatus halobius]